MWIRILAILAPGIFLFFTACSGSQSKKPPQPAEADFNPALIDNLYRQTLKAKQACAAAYQEPVILFAQQIMACGPSNQPGGGMPIPGGPGNGQIPQQQFLAAGGSPGANYGMVSGGPGIASPAPTGIPYPGCGIPRIPQPTRDTSECTNLVKDVLASFFTLRNEGKGQNGKPGKVVYYSTLPEAQAWLINEVGALINQMGATAQAQVPGLNLQDPAMVNTLLGGAGNLFLQNASSLGPQAMGLFGQAVQTGGGGVNPAVLTQLMGAR